MLRGLVTGWIRRVHATFAAIFIVLGTCLRKQSTWLLLLVELRSSPSLDTVTADTL